MYHPQNPTRWEGKKVLDYYLGNGSQLLQNVHTLDMKLADHLIIEGALDLSFRKAEAFEIAPVPLLPRINVDLDQWEQAVTAAWTKIHTPMDFSSNVNEIWKKLNDELWSTLVAAYLWYPSDKCVTQTVDKT